MHRLGTYIREILHNNIVRRACGGISVAFVSVVLILAPIQVQVPTQGGPLTTTVSIAHAVLCTSITTGEVRDWSGGCPSSVWRPSTQPEISKAYDLNCTLSGLSACLANIVYVFTAGIASEFADIAASFLNIAVHLSLTSVAYAQNFVSQGWTIARDVANMAFLFILIYIALVIMIQADTAGTISMLVTVIAVAMLVNFSFFGTRLVVDAGNIAAIQVYNAIPDSTNCSTPRGTISAYFSASCIFGYKDLTASIMNALNPQNLYSTADFQTFSQQAGAGFNGFMTELITLSILYIAVGAILAILGFAFFTAGAQFIMRIVMLWILIIISPLALAAFAVPNGKKFFNRWLKELLSNTFYPAVFLFIFLFLTLFMTALAASSGGNLITNLFSTANQSGPSASTLAQNGGYLYWLGAKLAVMIAELAFVIIFVKIALDAAKRLPGETVNLASRFGGWIQKEVIKGQKLQAGFAYQQTVARGAGMLNRTLGNRSKLANTFVGQVARRFTLGKVSGAQVGGARSFDQYRESAEKYRIEREDQRKKITDVAALKRTDELRTREQESKDYERYKTLQARRQYEGVLNADEERELGTLESRFKESGDYERYQKLKAQQAGRTLSPGDYAEYNGLRERFEHREQLARSAPPAVARRVEPQIPKQLTEEERNEKIVAEEKSKKAEVSALEIMMPAELIKRIHNLTDKQFEDLMKSRAFKTEDKDRFKEAWNRRGTPERPVMGQYGAPDNMINKFDKIIGELHNLSKKSDIYIDLQRHGAKDMKAVFERNKETVEKSQDLVRIQTQDLQRDINTLTREIDREKDPARKGAKTRELEDKKRERAAAQAQLRMHRKVIEKLDEGKTAVEKVPQHRNPEDNKEYAASDAEVLRSVSEPTGKPPTSV